MLLLLQVPQVYIPPQSWANDLLREAKSLQDPLGLARRGGFGDLRKVLLPPGDEEVRVWGGFGLSLLEATILQKKAGKWTATWLRAGTVASKYPPRKEVFSAPKSGWPVFWRKAEALGIWALPDDSTLPQEDRQLVFDGFSYLVELQRGGKYRAYAYNNPEFQTQWPEAKRMVAIDRLLGSQFPHGKK